MRHAHIALAATIAGLMVSATPSNAAPGTSLTSPAADEGLVQRSRGFRAVITGDLRCGPPPAVVVPHVVPVVPPAVAGEPGRRGAAAASDELCENKATGTAKVRRRPLQQALPRTAAVARTSTGSRLLRRVLEMILDLCRINDLIKLAPSSRARRRHGSRPTTRELGGIFPMRQSEMRSRQCLRIKLDYPGCDQSSRTKRSSP